MSAATHPILPYRGAGTANRALPIVVLTAAMGLFTSAALAEAWVILPVYACLVLYFSFRSPIMGVGLWLIPIPFEAAVATEIGFSPYLLITPALFLGAAVHVSGRPDYKLQSYVVVTGLSFLFAVTLASLFGDRVFEFRSFLSVGLLTISTMLGVLAVSNEPAKCHTLLISAILSALGATIFAALRFTDGWHLSMTPEWGGGVRALDGSIALALAVCLSVLLAPTKTATNVSKPLGLRARRILAAAGAVFFSLALLGTVSRGSILAVIVAVTLVSVVYIARAALEAQIPSRFFAVLIPAAAAAIAVPVINSVITRGHLISRTLSALEKPGENARWEIWQNGLSSLQGFEWILGSGVGVFEAVVGRSAHSLYMAALVETGVVGLSVISFALAVLGVAGLRKGGVAFLVYITVFLMCFLTRGSLSDKNFYAFLIVGWALATTLAPSVRASRHSSLIP